VIPNEEDAVAAALEMARPGDLVIIFGDNSSRCWKQIIYFNAPKQQPQDNAAATMAVAPVPFEDMIDGTQSMVRDARGVRLARSDVEDGD
jgi:cyanophycin synthetase